MKTRSIKKYIVLLVIPLALSVVLSSSIPAVWRLNELAVFFTETEEKIDYSSDAVLVVESIEEAHPIFMLDEIPAGYEEAKAEYLQYTSEPLTRTEFLLAAQKFIVVLGDGHMGWGMLGERPYIDISWYADDGSLYLLDDDKKPTDIEIVKIGGVPVSDVAVRVDTYYTAENDTSRQLNYTIFCRQEPILALAGCEYTQYGIELTTSDGELITRGFIRTKRAVIEAGREPEPRYVCDYKTIKDVFYIDLWKFNDEIDGSVSETIDAIKRVIKNGTRNGITKFIIDVRNNLGGQIEIGEQLVRAMRMTPPVYGRYVNNSRISKEQDYLAISKKPNIDAAKANKDITLLVLTNANSFSASMMLGVYVQDGNLGKVVGQISPNAPNCYSGVIDVELPLSDSELSISWAKYERPDTNADPDNLVPDIIVPFGEDILAVALEYIATV